MSDSFPVSNGVRQGGALLSPLLFNIYINELRVLLNMTRVGRLGLARLGFAVEHDIIF